MCSLSWHRQVHKSTSKLGGNVLTELLADEPGMQQLIFCTQQHLNAYARQGLRVLVMARRLLTDTEYNDWARQHEEIELSHDNRDRRIRDSFCRLETNLTLLGEAPLQGVASHLTVT